MSQFPSSSEPGQKWLALLSVCLASAAMPLTFTGTAVALPAIGRDLGGSAVAIAWATNAFMLVFGSVLMAMGAIADTLGRKRLFLCGASTFAVASLALTLAPTILVFDLLRAVQGLSGAAVFSGGLAALAQEFDGPGRIRAFSLVGASFGVGLSLGPITAGLMTEIFGWRSIFLAVVAFALLAVLLGRKTLHESRDPDSTGLDWPGAVSFTAALALFTYAVLIAPDRGWGDTDVIGLLFGALFLGVAFVMIENRVRRPMLDLTLFRYPRFIGVQLLAAAPAYGFVVLLILLPARFVGIDGMAEVSAGLLMIALSAPLLILPVLAGQLTRWFPPATICGLGLLICAAGLLWMAMVPPDAPPFASALPMLAVGAGISLPWGLMDGLAVSVVPKERAGMATGIFSTTRVAGEGVALAVVSAVLSALIAGQMAEAGLSGSTGLAAHLMAVGDLESATGLMPGAQRSMLVLLYGSAFSTLLTILAAITLVTALVVFVFLGRMEKVAEPDRA